jgi:hypothetical protein
MTKTPDVGPPPGHSNETDPLQTVRDALSQLRFGAIQLVIHEGKLVQMDITEKRRFA